MVAWFPTSTEEWRKQIALAVSPSQSSPAGSPKSGDDLSSGAVDSLQQMQQQESLHQVLAGGNLLRSMSLLAERGDNHLRIKAISAAHSGPAVMTATVDAKPDLDAEEGIQTLSGFSTASANVGVAGTAVGGSLFADTFGSLAEAVNGAVAAASAQSAGVAPSGDDLVRRFARVGVGAVGPSPDELFQLFFSEATSVRAVAGGSSVADAAVTAVLGKLLAEWERRLADDLAPSHGRRLSAPARRALLKSDAIAKVLQALMACQQEHHRRRFSSCSSASASSDDDSSVTRADTMAPITSAPGPVSAMCSDADGPMDGAGGDLLVHVLSMLSSSAPESLSELVRLLADSVEAADYCCRRELHSEGIAAEAEACWVMRILSSALLDHNEEDLLAASRLSEAAAEVLNDASKVHGATVGTASGLAGAVGAVGATGASPSGRSKPQVGDEVWACSPADGRWYRAHIKSHHAKRDRVTVTWALAPRAGGVTAAEGYLSLSCLKAGKKSLEVSTSSVVLVKATIRRPPPALDPAEDTVISFAAVPREAWEEHLCAAETHGELFARLSALCAELERHHRWEVCFGAAESVGVDGTASDSATGFGNAAASGTLPPLKGAADTLGALRVEVEERAEALLAVSLESAAEANQFRDQLSTSAAAAEVEREALAKERGHAHDEIERLRLRRAELTEALRGVNEELDAAEKRCSELGERETHLEASMARVAEELGQNLRFAREQARSAQRRRELLDRSVQAARVVEEEIAERAQAVADATPAVTRLSTQRELVGSACLRSDEARRNELSELLSIWHECVWGPQASVVMRNERLAGSLRESHTQALESVERAMKEVAEVAAAPAASPCGSGIAALDGLFGYDSGASATAAGRRLGADSWACYKDFKKQLKENIARLTELEGLALRMDTSPDAMYSLWPPSLTSCLMTTSAVPAAAAAPDDFASVCGGRQLEAEAEESPDGI